MPHLNRNPHSTYWTALEEAQRQKEKRRLSKQMQKIRKADKNDALDTLKKDWQACLDDMDLDMMIVRVALDTPNTYTIFYVSDRPYADGNRYPGFLGTVRQQHPRYRIRLCHIRDVDGHFVTRAEYRNRRRK